MSSKFHDLALSASPSPSLTSGGTLSARPRADLEREDRPLLWRERASTIVD
jgi:hypothetical protein